MWHFEATDAKIYTKLYKGSFKVRKSTKINADLAATTLCIRFRASRLSKRELNTHLLVAFWSKILTFLWHFEATDAKIYTKLYKGSFKVQKSTNTNADLADLPATTLCISLSTWGKYFNDYAIHVHKKGMVKTWKIA